MRAKDTVAGFGFRGDLGFSKLGGIEQRSCLLGIRRVYCAECANYYVGSHDLPQA